MGMVKQAALEHEGNIALATDYLVREGRLESCEYHGEVWNDGFDLDSDFYAKAMADRKRGANGPIPWAAEFGTREFTDLLKEAHEEHCGDGCGYCEKNERD